MSNLSPQTKEKWLHSLISHLHHDLSKGYATPNSLESHVHIPKRKLSKFKDKTVALTNRELRKIITEKARLDKRIIENAIHSIIEKLSYSQAYTKGGADYKNGNLFFWFEIRTNDDKSETFIKKEIQEANRKYNPSGLKVSFTLVEELLNLEVPPDYIIIS